MSNLLGMIFVGCGLALDLVGALGLIRFPDLMSRLQSSTKCVTLGTSAILFGTFLLLGFTAGGIKCLLGILFLLLSSPVAAHAIARAASRSGGKNV